MEKGSLLRTRKSDRSRKSHPRRRRLVDRAALHFGGFSPWIAVGRMQPPATEIDRECRAMFDRPSAPAEPCPCFDHETIEACVRDPPGRGDACCAATDDYDLSIAGTGHVFCLATWTRAAAHSSDPVNNRHVPKKRQRLFAQAQVHARSLPADRMGTFGGVAR